MASDERKCQFCGQKSRPDQESCCTYTHVMRAKGLHVVTDADMRVLEAMRELRPEWLIEMLGADRCFPNDLDCQARIELHEAELARREAKRGE